MQALSKSERCSERPISSFPFRRVEQVKILHIFRSEPDETVQNIVKSTTNGDESKVTELYQDNIDWFRLVDDIFSHQKVVSWWWKKMTIDDWRLKIEGILSILKNAIAYIEIVFWPVVQIKREALDKTKIKSIEILK